MSLCPPRHLLTAALLLVCVWPLAVVRAEKVAPVQIPELRAAVAKALPLLERSSAFALQERACFTCHHGAHPSLVIHDAWARGFGINTTNFEDQLTRAYRGLIEDGPRFKDGWSIAGTADGPGTALWMLEVAGWQPDAITASATEFFLNDVKHPDHWAPPMRRPPTVGSEFTTTYLVLRGLRNHRTPELASRIRARSTAVGKWLMTAPARDTEDSVHRLRALQLLDVDEATFQTELKELLAVQHADGGWPQKLDTESDPYATGTVLAALHDTGALAVGDAIFQRGLRYLLQVQATDGSWHVRKRTHDVQPFFDSSFPHGVDQFISISATSWASYALLRAVPLTAKKTYLAAHPQAAARVLAGARPNAEPHFTEAQLAFFREKIEPVLVAQCYECHSVRAKKLKAHLFLDTRAGLLAGGDSGPVLRPHDPDHSLILRALLNDHQDLMPPKKPLAEAVIADFRRWIEMGAPDSRAEPTAKPTAYK
ncbi:MAG: hypothetical protein EB141_03080 [Verrucomicrobia bacterium]|nr:hypothetical protein [Verrucomicrobiota bacterium]NBU07911.1 hypothetical protein [Pseudomonadota bacterium]NDA65504.1 hypothetical protein [Verrucomicrobiota bacterium]NDB74621.1 hypothetical protein [Verrucomicrobiota bacterium]NDD37377.1 hypothetical protein [Verrucomicrobiota bacterium]